jgi:hypothetical protein
MLRNDTRRRTGALLTCFLAALLAACGGGGDTPPREVPIGQAVRLANVSAPPVNADLFEGYDLGLYTVTADATGDLSRLDGQTIYVIVVDPAGLFDTAPIVSINPAGTGNRITLRGATLQRQQTGRLAGNLQINVCVDAACTRPLGNSPILVPYDVNVRPGLRFDTGGPVVVNSTVGAQSAPVTVRLEVPAGFGPPTVFSMWPGQIEPAATTAYAAAPVGEVMLQGNPAMLGRYDGLLHASINATLAGRSFQLNASVPIVYEVTAGPSAPILAPASLDIAVRRSGPPLGQNLEIFGADGRRYRHLSRVVYQPPGPQGNLAATGWLIVSSDPVDRSWRPARPSVHADPCPLPTRVCLPDGRYEGLVYFRTDAGEELGTPLPVTMRVSE